LDLQDLYNKLSFYKGREKEHKKENIKDEAEP